VLPYPSPLPLFVSLVEVVAEIVGDVVLCGVVRFFDAGASAEDGVCVDTVLPHRPPPLLLALSASVALVILVVVVVVSFAVALAAEGRVFVGV